MEEENVLDKSKVLILVISIVLLIVGMWFGLNCFDEKGNIKGLFVLLGSGFIAYSLKNFHALINGISNNK